MSVAHTIEELIDVVQGELTISCALPKLLPDNEIRRLVENKAMPWFYQNYQYATQKMYYFIDCAAFSSDEWTKYKYIAMPEEIQTIIWIYPIRNISLFQLGINAPNLSINLGVTNQPYLSSYVTTIGELGTYKSILDSMSDMLNQLSKHTVKHHFNQMAHRLNILTALKENMIVEAYANVEQEALFADPEFIKYVTGLAKVQLGNMATRYDFTYPGGVKLNGDGLISEGKEDIADVVDRIKGQSQVAWFYMNKK